ncbi:acyl carrier protein [Paraburkholderia humisilvae]|uniref:Polyketide biosynthesis acyl-carrier-protein AcpK n=1 Tax=Paraburkholderia humisilvae TaxID=627669 RepID=A0A6J5EH34_9BURK|nr:acyl carrier protein [Paraburkholderia humisilvae]CAB3765799.1 Polyketide biosynthesis acyl-carrier-protein AcpK [Paraburkholderia humisilvae]
MKHDQVLDIIVRHTRETLPHLRSHTFKPTDSLRTLGANSIDRADIIMMTLESLSLSIPLIEMARAENIGELARIIHGKY